MNSIKKHIVIEEHAEENRRMRFIVHTDNVTEELNERLRAALIADVEFARWRMTLFRDMLALLNDIRNWVRILEREPSLIGLLKVCVKSRLYWSRRHSALLALRPSEDQRREFDQFSDLMQRVESLGSKVLDKCESPEQKSLTEHYLENMGLRRILVDADRQSLDVLYDALMERGGRGADDDQDQVLSFDVGSPLEAQDLVTAILLCASFWILDHKLASWLIELRRESGPFALSVCDHSDLLKGTVKLFGMMTDAASKALPDPDSSILKPYIEKAAEIQMVLLSISQSLGDSWKSINKNRAINLDENQRNITEIYHPDDDVVKILFTKVSEKVSNSQKLARQTWAIMRQSMISDDHWRFWERVSFSGNSELPVAGDGKEAVESLIERFQNSHDSERIEAWIDFLCTRQDIAVNDANSLVCDLLARLFEVRFILAKKRAEKLIVDPVPANIGPKGLFQLQVVGVVMRQIVFDPKVYLHEAAWVKVLIETVFTRELTIYGSEQHRNAVVASLLALYYTVCSSAWRHSGELSSLTEYCLNRVSNDKLRTYFRQSLADDLSVLMPDLVDGSNAAKLSTLAKYLKPELLRWKDVTILDALAYVSVPPKYEMA